MDLMSTLASAAGLGLLAGIRLYATVFAVGLLLRFHWIELPAGWAHASVLADTRVLILAGAARAIEFVADKVPWLDSAWDAVHTFIRPIGAVVAASSLFTHLDPAWQLCLWVHAGGFALRGPAAKSATRLFVNHSPEPFSNIALSLAEDAAVAGGVYLWATHPWAMAALAVAFLIVFVWLAPRIYRAIRVEWAAFRSLVRHWFGKPVAPRLSPDQERRFSEHSGGALPVTTLAAIATSDLKGLGNAIGTLSLAPGRAVFFTRRWGRAVDRTLEPVAVDVRSRLLLDQLTLVDLAGGRTRFDLLAGQRDLARRLR